MSFGFSSLGHVFATVFHDISKGAKAVGTALAKAQTEEAIVEDLTSIVYPPAVLAERAAFAILGKAAAVVHDAGPAADASGLNVQLDAQTVADLKDLIATVKGDLAALGVTAPKAAPAATAPAPAK